MSQGGPFLFDNVLIQLSNFYRLKIQKLRVKTPFKTPKISSVWNLSLAVIDKTGNPASKKTHEETPEKEIKPKEKAYSLKKCNYLELRLASFLPYTMSFNNLMLILMTH